MGQPRRLAVTGATGFIGTHLASRLEADGYDVVRVDRRTPGAPFDLRYWPDTEEALRGCDWVFHLAADMGGVGYFHGPNDYAAATDNARIDLNVLRACQTLNVDRMFYASSACVYPVEWQQKPGSAPRLPEGWVGFGTPDALYGAEKLWTLRACEAAPFDARVGILHTVYGPGQEAQGPRAKFPPSVAHKAIQAADTGSVEIWGDGRQLRSYLYVDDAVDRIVTIMTVDHYNGPVNVGYEGAISCLEAATFACNAVGVDPELVTNPSAGPTGVQSRDCDNTKWRHFYGDTDDTPPAEGFARLVDSLREEVPA